MKEVYVHELFHALHHSIINDETTWVECHTIIKESFASFFEYLYCTNKSIYVFDLQSDWLAYDMNTYPYAGAKYLNRNLINHCVLENPNNHNDVIQDLLYCTNLNFEKIFKLSLQSPKQALALLNLYHDYYNI